jgi:hypothetical protein
MVPWQRAMNQFRIRGDSTGYRIYVSCVMSGPELRARHEHMLDMGWKPNEVISELEIMQSEEDMSGPDAPFGYDMAEDYVLTYTQPGDIIYVAAGGFLVQGWGIA